MLWRAWVRHAEIGYSGVARTEVALRGVARSRAMIVFPYFLFTGVLVRRHAPRALRRQASGHRVRQGALSRRPSLVIETFFRRIRGIGAGDDNMNCSLCKYRTQVILRGRCRRAAETITMSRHRPATGTTTITGKTIITIPTTTSPPAARGEARQRAETPDSATMPDYLRSSGDLRPLLRPDPPGRAGPVSLDRCTPWCCGWSMPAACRMSRPTWLGMAIRRRRCDALAPWRCRAGRCGRCAPA
jgi:hypothetical protein